MEELILLEFSNKKVSIGEKLSKEIFDQIIVIDHNLDDLPGKTYNFFIKDDDDILFDCIEYIINLIVCKKSIFILGKGKNIYVFICCFLERWNKYDLQKALEMTEVFYRIIYPLTKLKFNRFELGQIKRYRPPISVFICGDENAHREYDGLIEMELKNLPRKSTVYHGTSKGIDRRVKEISKKLGIETEEVPLDNKLIREYNGDLKLATFIRDKNILEAGIDLILIFHPDIEHNTFKIIEEAKTRKIDVYVFDLKIKEKIL